MAMPRWTLTLDEARSALVHAVGKAAASPVMCSGLPELSAKYAQEGKMAFMDKYMAKPALQAINELLGGTTLEGVYSLPDGRRFEPGCNTTLDVVRFEVMLTLLDEKAMEGVLVSDGEEFQNLVEELSVDANDLFKHQYLEALNLLHSLEAHQKPSGSTPHPGVVQVISKPASLAAVQSLNEELNGHWSLVAQDSSCGRLYMSEDDHVGLCFRIVHDPAEAFVGQIMFSESGAQKISGAALAEFGLFPTVTDIAALNQNAQFPMWNQVKKVLEEQGIDGLRRAECDSPAVALCVDDILGRRDAPAKEVRGPAKLRYPKVEL
jgi:hypothetical protein